MLSIVVIVVVSKNTYNCSLLMFWICFRDAQNVQLPSFGKYATGIFYLDKLHHKESEDKFSSLAEELGMSVLAWRTVPTDSSTIGTVAKNSEPFMRQVNLQYNYFIIEQPSYWTLNLHVCHYLISLFKCASRITIKPFVLPLLFYCSRISNIHSFFLKQLKRKNTLSLVIGQLLNM